MINHIKQENHEYKRIRFQILAQAPTNETNKELWLKRQEYLWICRLGTLSKLSNKGLNKLIYDPIFIQIQTPNSGVGRCFSIGVHQTLYVTLFVL